jgi:4-hydroxy-tetrahydrodipicolinate synthase
MSVALTTPFQSSGQSSDEVVDARLLAHAQTLLASGCDSVTLFGTTGEGASIGQAERGRLLDLFEDAGITGDRLVVGIAATAAGDAVAQIRAAQAAGSTRVLLPPPYYFKQPFEDGVENWYRSVIEQLEGSSVGIILYNIPSQTAVPLSVELISRLRKAFGDTIIGVKDSSGDWDNTQALLAEHGDFAVLVGDERHLAAAVRKGAQGSIGGMANLDPVSVRRMAIDGEDSPYIVELIELLLKYPLIPAIKGVLAHQSGEPGWNAVRAPLVTLGAGDLQRLTREFDKLTGQKAA